MRILFYSEGANRWIEPLNRKLDELDIQWKWVNRKTPVKEILSDIQLADKVVSMWADEAAVLISKSIKDKPFYVYIRAYECYTDFMFKIDWSKVAGIFFCAEHIQEIANERNPELNKIPQYFIPNWIDVDEFKIVPGVGTKIAMACSVSWKKNLPMALQILSILPKEYTLHHAGWVMEPSLDYYCKHIANELGLTNRVFWNGPIPPKDMPSFYEDKNFILSTSIREACPMNILEGMACGLKPVVHNWLGATEIFNDWSIFNDIRGAVHEIGPFGWKNEKTEYRNFVKEHHGLNHADSFIKIIGGRV
jgi:glycosyltransferase involved in cell wall biosynthesis